MITPRCFGDPSVRMHCGQPKRLVRLADRGLAQTGNSSGTVPNRLKTVVSVSG